MKDVARYNTALNRVFFIARQGSCDHKHVFARLFR